ncbi:helix-turn-helix domain-containing protein [Clostridium paridis]|uniref:Helix-turn-helix domain-containing protein n=1 Tax=Clostridium paridis TaxID=2803863 RepID=A0A937FHC5_9CLOT|nr:helix-turn-helix domain-containing protein [Clostridium paridis]MBL4933025.1 helix-turn-helix domain-containing protein [Clostridium paridis]
MEQILYTVSEVSELLKINKNAVYELLKKRRLQGLKLGSMKVTRSELLRFLEENTGNDLSNLDDVKELTF